MSVKTFVFLNMTVLICKIYLLIAHYATKYDADILENNPFHSSHTILNGYIGFIFYVKLHILSIIIQ
jgi:hypothetical protein